MGKYSHIIEENKADLGGLAFLDILTTEIIKVQIDDDINEAEKYVNDNFVWTEEMQLIGDKLQKEITEN